MQNERDSFIPLAVIINFPKAGFIKKCQVWPEYSERHSNSNVELSVFKIHTESSNSKRKQNKRNERNERKEL